MKYKLKESITEKQLVECGYTILKTCYFKNLKDEWVIRIDKSTKKIKCWNALNGNVKKAKKYIVDLISKDYVEVVE